MEMLDVGFRISDFGFRIYANVLSLQTNKKSQDEI